MSIEQLECMRRLGFSQRMGYIPPDQVIQLESIDTRLENALWNFLHELYLEGLRKGHSKVFSQQDHLETAITQIWAVYFGLRIDEMPKDSLVTRQVDIAQTISLIKEEFFKSTWHEKYDLVEFVVQFDIRHTKLSLQDVLNAILERENSGYRSINGEIVPITSNDELKQVTEVIELSGEWQPVSRHMQLAVEILGRKESPDYRNVIKESILAVEALCQIISGNPKSTLGQAIAIIEKDNKLHGAFTSSMKSLYGFTSDGTGIRHSLLEEDIEIGMAEAVYMLVNCSAFINYMKNKIASNGSLSFK